MKNKTDFNQTGLNFFIGFFMIKNHHIFIGQAENFSPVFLNDIFERFNQILALQCFQLLVLQFAEINVKHAVII